MKDGSNISEFSKLLTGHIKARLKVQTMYVTVSSVDWNEKTMVGVGVVDGLPFPDIKLGFGSSFKRPALESTCLIGMIENQDAAAFLIEGESIESIEFHNGGGELQGLAMGVVVKELFDDLIDELGSSTVITMMGMQPLLNGPQIASLKASTAQIVSQLIKSNK